MSGIHGKSIDAGDMQSCYGICQILIITFIHGNVRHVELPLQLILHHPIIIIAVGRIRQILPSFPVLLFGVSPYISL